MKKKPAKDIAEARPQSAQVGAISRLADEGRVAEARERLIRLRRQFPDFKPLLALAYQVEALAGSPITAAVAALDWTRASPNSVAAWEALRDTTGMDFSALCLSVVRHLDVMQGKPLSPEPEDVPSPFGTLSFDQARRMDLCRLLLSNSRFDEAEAAIADIDHVSARNNMAVIAFGRGHIDKARARLEASWQEVPSNLFALERLIRLRLWTGGLDQASGLVAPLLETEPLRWDDKRAKMIGLLLLDRFDQADAYFAASADSGLPHEQSEFCFLGAYAAWRLEKAEAARDRLRQAHDLDEHNETAQETLDALVFGQLTADSPDWPIGDFASWWPVSQIQALQSCKVASDAEAAVLLNRLSPHPDYLGRMAEQGGEGGRLLAVSILKSRAEAGDGLATVQLRSLLARPCGPDRQRADIHGWLADKALIAKGEVSRLLIGGKLKDVRAHNRRITAEATADNELPAGDAREYERVHDLAQAGKTEQAHALMSRLHEKYPDSPRILANLAAIRHALGHPAEEIEALVRRAHAIDPDYLFARTHLAKLLALRGNTDAATELLKPLGEREEMHISEWRSYTLAQIDIAKASGDFAGILRLMRTLDDMTERFGH